MADETPETPTPFDASSLNDTDLYAEYARAGQRGAELAAMPELTAEESAELGELATRSTLLRGEIAARHTQAQEEQANRDAFANFEPLTPPVVTPVAPAAPVDGSVTASEAAPVTPVTPVVPSVSEMASQPIQTPAAPVRTGGLRVELSADASAVLGRNAGDETSFDDITTASTRLFQQFGQTRNAGEGRVRRSLGRVVRDRDESLVLPLRPDPNAELSVINHARNERRLDGGSLLRTWANDVAANGDAPDALTAAAGWCAPSENRYDLCSLWALDGLLDLPTTTAPRGGINYTPDFTWAQINDAAYTSFTKLTEAQVIADTPKNCTELPCPTFTDRRLDVAVTCITGSFLQTHAYPEVVNTWRDGLLTKHAYEVNKDIIQQILAFAPAPVVIPAQGAVASGSTPDTSAASSLLSAIELAAIDMRERSNMSFGTTLEVILPRWVLTQLRADIARRNAWHADPFALANATIVSWFTTRGVRPQFIRGWQDAQSGLVTGPGDITAPITPLTALPTTVNFLIYPAGAIVLAREDVVTLTNVYDAASLKQNLYTALFTEEAYAPIFPCGEVREYTANLCPSGATGHQVWTSCAAPAA